MQRELELNAQTLIATLFPRGHDVIFDGPLIAGIARVGERRVNVIGTQDETAIGVELALRLAAAVLEACRKHPAEPLVLLIDTCGQRLSRRDELLGINAYMAHLAKCLHFARRMGSPIIGLAYNEAVSAGILATTLFADDCYALPETHIRVMNLLAMSRVMKVSLDRLQHLAQTSPVFAPGVENFLAMGAVRAVWTGNLSKCLEHALNEPGNWRQRRLEGERRGGRLLANRVTERIRHAAT